MNITRAIYDAAELLRAGGDIAGMYQLLAAKGEKLEAFSRVLLKPIRQLIFARQLHQMSTDNLNKA